MKTVFQQYRNGPWLSYDDLFDINVTNARRYLELCRRDSLFARRYDASRCERAQNAADYLRRKRYLAFLTRQRRKATKEGAKP